MRPKVKDLIEVAKKAWVASEPVRRDAKAAWEKTAPARQLDDMVGDARDNFDIVLRQAESREDVLKGTDDDLNKLWAVTDVLNGDASKIVDKLGYGVSKEDKRRDGLLSAGMEMYGVNSFSVKQSREAVSKMEDDLRRLTMYNQFAEVAPALAAVIIGKGLIDLKQIAEKMSSIQAANPHVAKDIYLKCEEIKSYYKYGHQTLKLFQVKVSSDANVLSAIAPDS